MKVSNTLTVKDRKEWRTWLEKNHSKAKEIWMVYYKKHTGKPTIPYEDAVEEAICFGWIDSIVKRIDEERYAQKYTPRKPTSIWSDHNRRRAGRMIRQGRMTEAGLIKIREAKKNGQWSKEKAEKKKTGKEPTPLPGDLKKAIAANRKAKANFDAFPPSCRRQYIGWVVSAKREETRKRRIKEAVKMISKNTKSVMK